MQGVGTGSGCGQAEMEVHMGPLKGIRIVELEGIGPVPLAAMLLADMGADVVRVTRAGGAPGLGEMGAAILHRGRTNVALDLKSEEGRNDLLGLVTQADALLEGFRPGVMERLNLSPETCLERNPALVYARMTGWGQHGEMAARAGHDLNYISVTGALAAIGAKDEPPTVPLNLIGDYGGGSMFLVTGVLAALLEARMSGKGQVVDVAMSDAVPLLMSLMSGLAQSGLWTMDRGSNLLDGGAPFYRCYRCADDGYVAVGALEPKFFAELLDGLGLAGDAFNQMDRHRWPAMGAAFAERFASRPRDEWAALFAGRDACVTPVLDMNEAPGWPHHRTRKTWQTRDGTVHPMPAPRFCRTPSEVAEAIDADIGAVLTRWQRRPLGADG